MAAPDWRFATVSRGEEMAAGRQQAAEAGVEGVATLPSRARDTRALRIPVAARPPDDRLAEEWRVAVVDAPLAPGAGGLEVEATVEVAGPPRVTMAVMATAAIPPINASTMIVWSDNVGCRFVGQIPATTAMQRCYDRTGRQTGTLAWLGRRYEDVAR